MGLSQSIGRAGLRVLRLLTVGAALALASCADLENPFDTASDFAGQPLSDGRSPPPADPRDECEAMAENRAQDVRTEGYDEALQKHVHDAVLADCRTWLPRH